jgi:hypothetical protein
LIICLLFIYFCIYRPGGPGILHIITHYRCVSKEKEEEIKGDIPLAFLQHIYKNEKSKKRGKAKWESKKNKTISLTGLYKCEMSASLSS